MVSYYLEKIADLHVCVASHNEKSMELATAKMAEKGLSPNDERVFFAQLYGMSDNLTFNLAKAGYRAGKYLPYGPLKEVLPYLFRRAQENTSVAGQSGRELLLIKKENERRKSLK